MADALVVGVPYRCTGLAADRGSYGAVVANLRRADGIAGWLLLSGFGVQELEVDKVYCIREHQHESETGSAEAGPGK